MNGIIKCVITIVIVSFSMNTIAFADNLTEQLQQQQQQTQKNQIQLKTIQDDIEKMEIKIEQSDGTIEKLMMEIENGKKEINDTKKNVENIEDKINEIQSNIKQEEDLFGQRMRIMYANGVEDYLEVLLSAENMNDFLSRIENIRTIIEYDKEFLANLEIQKEEVKYEQDKLNRKQTYLLNIQKENNNKLSSLKKQKEEQSQLIEILKKMEKSISDKINIYQGQIDQTIKQIKENKMTQPRNIYQIDMQSAYNNDILQYAISFLGTPYVWGGTTPVPGFDCSGFTQYVYAHFGIKIGRTTYDQIKDGVEVSKENLQPGDLILFGTVDNPHHIGIYLGNNYFIHAPKTGDVIKVSPLTRSDYLTARRIMVN